MKIWKRNAIVATVLVLICAGVYMNWNAEKTEAADLTDTLDAEQVMGAALSLEADSAAAQTASGDTFAQIRLSRQQSRDSAVELLQETLAYEDGSETASQAATSLDAIVSDALAEAQVESLVIAKGYQDCVAYMNGELISIAVAAPEEGLTETDVALISDIVTAQTDYDLTQIRIIEVK